LIKTDSQGIEEWNQIFSNGNSDGSASGYSVMQTTDGGYILNTGNITISYGEGFKNNPYRLIVMRMP